MTLIYRSYFAKNYRHKLNVAPFTEQEMLTWCLVSLPRSACSVDLAESSVSDEEKLRRSCTQPTEVNRPVEAHLASIAKLRKS